MNWMRGSGPISEAIARRFERHALAYGIVMTVVPLVGLAIALIRYG